MRKLIAAILGMWALGAGAAYADDFTFVVPVDLHAIAPEISQLQVRCAVSTLGTDTAGPPRGIVGNGVASAPIIGGAFHADVTVVVNASVHDYARYADHYSCDFILHRHMSDGSWRVYYPDSARTFMPLSPTAPYVITTGSLPLH